mmetsp:Transcript_23452/g.35604  ORF Transcript_23452/g.35604 Transcript_23452/m.35604 type:complete len:253 (+) Transcript_23452:611-1369(+)
MMIGRIPTIIHRRRTIIVKKWWWSTFWSMTIHGTMLARRRQRRLFLLLLLGGTINISLLFTGSTDGTQRTRRKSRKSTRASSRTRISFHTSIIVIVVAIFFPIAVGTGRSNNFGQIEGIAIRSQQSRSEGSQYRTTLPRRGFKVQHVHAIFINFGPPLDNVFIFCQFKVGFDGTTATAVWFRTQTDNDLSPLGHFSVKVDTRFFATNHGINGIVIGIIRSYHFHPRYVDKRTGWDRVVVPIRTRRGVDPARR